MSLFEKSGQSVGDNSSAIQVTGDAYFGNTTTEVMAICQLMVKSEMASLREDAFALVDSRAQEFGHQIAEKLSKDVDEKLRAKLADPDIQYTLNQAVVQVARKGFDAKSELLKELIVTKIENDQEDQSILIDQALDTTSRLTTNDIKFLAFVYFLRSINKMVGSINITELAEKKSTHFSLPNISLEENYMIHRSMYAVYETDYIKFLGEHFTLKRLNQQPLEIKGVFFSDKIYNINYLELLSKRTGYDTLTSDASFYEAFPATKLVLDSFGISTLTELDSLVINPVGMIIAENYLKAHGYIS